MVFQPLIIINPITFQVHITQHFMGFSPTQKPVEWMGAALFTFSGGKITDLWVLGDVDGLKAQLSANAG